LKERRGEPFLHSKKNRLLLDRVGKGWKLGRGAGAQSEARVEEKEKRKTSNPLQQGGLGDIDLRGEGKKGLGF